jgi:GT2 family glycosyltransferase
MVSIITVNYKSKRFLPKLLDSIQKFVKDEYEYIIVDNDSGDNLDEIEKKYEGVSVIYSNKNAGFGAGINIGAKQAQGEFLYFLNPDTYLLSDTVRIQKNLLESDSKIAIVGGCMVQQDGSLQKFQYGNEPHLKDLFTRSEKKQQDTPPPTASQEVDWVSGGAMMVRREDFLNIGGFDERFFMYYEDIDISKRMKQSGRLVYWTPDAKLTHIEGGSETVYKKTKERYYASQRKYFAKHVGLAWSFALWGIHQVLLTQYR